MIIVAIVLVLAGLWDLYAIWRWGIGSGYTVSWQTYSFSRQYPVIAFGAGYAMHCAFPGYGLAALAFFVAGHIWATMRGA